MRGGALFFGDGGDGSLATWLVASERAEARPLPFLAVTRTRSVAPRSSWHSVSACARPEVSAQSPPAEEPRRHRYENRIPPAAVHVPGTADSARPTIGEPEIVGWVAACGACAAWAATAPVGDETADVDPSRFVAVTDTRSA